MSKKLTQGICEDVHFTCGNLLAGIRRQIGAWEGKER